jgi:putative transposase
MKTSRFTDSQIIAILKQAKAGSPVPELCSEHGISNATFYEWRAKFGGMDASLMARMKELEDENRPNCAAVWVPDSLMYQIVLFPFSLIGGIFASWMCDVLMSIC